MKIYLDQKKFNTYLIRLLEKINPKMDEFDTVVSILNGGYNVGMPIAKFFGKIHTSIHISYYDGEQMLFEPFVQKDFKHLQNIKSPFLLVDDIIDTGSTLRYFINNTGLKKGIDFHVASIHWCEDNSPDLRPEYFVSKKSKLDWIVYHWEMENV